MVLSVSIVFFPPGRKNDRPTVKTCGMCKPYDRQLYIVLRYNSTLRDSDHSAGLLPIGRFGGRSPPKRDLFVTALCQRSWHKAVTKELFSGACGPHSPAGEFASSYPWPLACHN